MTFTNEQLVAFLDGELSDQEAQAIATALETDADLATRLESLHVDFAPISDAFNSVLSDAPKITMPEILETQMESFNWRGLMNIAAAACVALVVGFVAGRETVPEPKMGWVEAVANYQVLYTEDTLAALKYDNGLVEGAADIQRVSAALGLTIDPADLAVNGLTYKRAQILAYEDKPLGQFVYQTEAGIPVAICIVKSGKPDSSIRVKNPQGMTAAIWNKGGYGFIVIGNIDEAQALQTAEQITTSI